MENSSLWELNALCLSFAEQTDRWSQSYDTGNKENQVLRSEAEIPGMLTISAGLDMGKYTGPFILNEVYVWFSDWRLGFSTPPPPTLTTAFQWIHL